MKDTNAKVCDVHGRPMGSWSVRVVYGVRRGLKQSPDYLRARRAQFPNCDDWVNGGCVLREARSRHKLVCPRCVEARDAFVREQYASWLRSNQPDLA